MEESHTYGLQTGWGSATRDGHGTVGTDMAHTSNFGVHKQGDRHVLQSGFLQVVKKDEHVWEGNINMEDILNRQAQDMGHKFSYSMVYHPTTNGDMQP